ncbi:MAG TPA: cation diffusion facilitator family transporter [Streptosporangiaceae bacterium]|nr:cation diffusion facilitator family transporter [Streptosporangiaceae bacterium]
MDRTEDGRAARGQETRSTRRTVLIAGAANLFVALVKLAAGILVGSSAMLAEAAHSVADTLNQGFLLTSVHKAQRPADAEHPFGYGQERYFWSLLAAFGIFIAGGGFSVFEGIMALHRSAGSRGLLFAYLALAAAVIAEGTSLVRVTWQTRRQARQRQVGLLQHIRSSPDMTVKAALFEDSVAIVGLLLAFAGLLLRQLTGSEVYDAGASIAIGALLIAAAIRLGAENRELLIGKAADPGDLAVIRSQIEATEGISAVLDLLTMYLGPDHLIVAAKVAFDDDLSADSAEDVADSIDDRLSAQLSVIPHVFLDPTQLPAGSAAALRPKACR